jgi:integrase
MELKPTPPHDAKQRYLKEKATHVTEKTHYNYSTTMRQFSEWLAENGYGDLRNVDSDVVDQYKEYRLTQVKPITARNDMRIIKNFIEYCESIQAVPVGLGELIRVPKISEDDEVCDDILTRQEAKDVLDYLSTYEYASARHVVVLILWKTGMRTSGLLGLDQEDFDEGRPAIEVRHRPDSRTPLKRKKKSQRDILIKPEVATVISDYISGHRNDVTDEHGRNPLVTTKNGRVSRTQVQKYVYTSTRPCVYNGKKCPFERDTKTCEAMRYDLASKCPGSVSPHALRRGYVTAARNAGQPKDVTGDRVNMSGPVLDKHYDHGNYDEKAERRREHLRDI